MVSRSAPSIILTITCPDRAGIVANVATHLASLGAFITESAHFGDADTARFFFMRTVFYCDARIPSRAKMLTETFLPIADRFDMQ